MNYEFHPDAEEELIEAAAWYDAEVPGLGSLFGEEALRTIELLLENPTAGLPIGGQLRRFVMRRFPHTIIYTPGHDTLFVVAVAHTSRRPGYWRSRENR